MALSDGPEIELAGLLDEFMPPEISEMCKQLIVSVARKYESIGVESMRDEVKKVHAEYALRRELREEILEEEARVRRRKEIEAEAITEKADPRLNPDVEIKDE